MSNASKYISNLVNTPEDNKSIMQKLSELPDKERIEILDKIVKTKYPDIGFKALKYDWDLWARPSQLIPFDFSKKWSTFCLCMGRSWGKSRVSSEWCRRIAETRPGVRIGIIGPTNSDVVKTMITGNSGIMSICPPWNMPVWNQNHQKIEWANKSIVQYFSGEKCDRLRGPQFHYAWIDEFTSVSNVENLFDMLSFCLRLGEDNRTLISTTPKNQEFFKKLLSLPTTWTITGSTFENKENVSKKYLDEMVLRYVGTRLGQQELEADILEDDKDALWQREWIERNRIRLIGGKPERPLPDIIYMVVGVDPAVTAKKNSDYTGISVVGYGTDGMFYVFEARGVKKSPRDWAIEVLNLFDKYKADKIIVETNNGGDLVKENIHTFRPLAPVEGIFSIRGKILRAEPVANLYESGKVCHIGTLAVAEDQLCNFQPIKNPNARKDIVDSLVFSVTEIMNKYAFAVHDTSYTPAVGGMRDRLTNLRLL